MLFKLLYVNSFRPTQIPELLLCCALQCSHSRLFCARRRCLHLLQLCLLFNQLRSSAFSPFSTGFCQYCIFHTSLSPIFHTSLSPSLLHKLMRFLILSFCLSHTVKVFSYFHFSYPMKPLGERSLILLSVVLPSVGLLPFKLLYVNSFRPT